MNFHPHRHPSRHHRQNQPIYPSTARSLPDPRHCRSDHLHLHHCLPRGLSASSQATHAHTDLNFLVIPLILGSIVGVQLGQKLGQYLDGNQLKSLFALLLCSVAIAIAYDTFFREQSQLINEQQSSLTFTSLKIVFP